MSAILPEDPQDLLVTQATREKEESQVFLVRREMLETLAGQGTWGPLATKE